MLLTTNNTKIQKSIDAGIPTTIMHLLPSTLSGKDVCPKASAGCRAACLNTAGRGKFNSVQLARARRTQLFHDDKFQFYDTLTRELRKLKAGTAVRLNGTSDIDHQQWYKKIYDKTLWQAFPDLRWYDYTKRADMALKYYGSPYYLTFSRSEDNEDTCLELLSKFINVAIVFDELPQSYKGVKVIDGDVTDGRFLDEYGVIIGLKAKGDAKKDTTGFVVRTS